MAYIKTITSKDAGSQNNGGKIMGLAQLQQYGLPIPETFFIAPKDSVQMFGETGAEKLQNVGDMLFGDAGRIPVRIHSAFVQC